MRKREPRRKVLIAARMRAGAGWADIRIENMSSRGLLVSADAPPAPGTYLEIRRAAHVIVGRAVWRRGNQFGVRTQDRLDLDAIIQLPRMPEGPRPTTPTGLPVERRSDPARVGAPDVAQRLERSRQISSLLQLVFLVMLGLGAATLAATLLHDVLARPVDAIGRSLPDR